MKLGTHLTANGITHAEFAIRIRTSQAAVTRYVLGQRTPRPDVIARISEATAGEVTANDFMPDYAHQPAPEQTGSAA
ncbi:helix-turn-helix transcriptional regulator [Xanthobacter dioxanivorans]|uniref:Helix-turn-helix transcriptional regulator n=1 Tax=Xanthobacter dioxanivorans TaxID=2528964 RepID=A0A974PMN6_9HYPH|nr:helix-turn-helix transcriptional regulator [Xanthobacter dioxanivorans]